MSVDSRISMPQIVLFSQLTVVSHRIIDNWTCPLLRIISRLFISESLCGHFPLICLWSEQKVLLERFRSLVGVFHASGYGDGHGRSSSYGVHVDGLRIQRHNFVLSVGQFLKDEFLDGGRAWNEIRFNLQHFTCHRPAEKRQRPSKVQL